MNLAQTRYVYLGRHLIGKDGAPGLRYLHTDALGSLVAETDASQTVTQRYHYLPYGAAFGTMPDGPGYAGNVMDPSGLTYMQARYYDPQLGRFLSTDPVDPDPQTGMNFNRYAYADNNPFAKYDPSGRDAACIYTEGTCDDGSGAGDAFLSDVIDSVLPPMMAMQPELGAAEGAAVAAAEEVGEVASDVVKGAEAAAEELPAIKAGAASGETSGKAFPQSVRRAALDENQTTCVYCRMETESPQVDHAIPRARSGNATIDNAQTTCPWCNASKGARDFPVNPPPGYEGQWPPPWWEIL